MNMIEIKKNTEQNKILNLDDLVKINFKSSLYENIKITDNIKIFMIIKTIPIEQIALVFEIIDQFKDFIYNQYKIEINEYIILYNQHQNKYRVIFQDIKSDLFNNRTYVNNFIKNFENIYEQYIDTEIYNQNSINIICPLQFETNDKGKYKRRSKSYNYYKIVFYKRHNQIMFYDMSYDYIRKYYSKYKLFELTFDDMHNYNTIYKSLIAHNDNYNTIYKSLIVHSYN